jgi:hypothetical protein
MMGVRTRCRCVCWIRHSSRAWGVLMILARYRGCWMIVAIQGMRRNWGGFRSDIAVIKPIVDRG